MGGEFGNVVDKDQVRVKVHHSADARGEQLGQVTTRVVQRAIQRGADGRGDQSRRGRVVEGVYLEFQVRKGVGDGGA